MLGDYAGYVGRLCRLYMGGGALGRGLERALGEVLGLGEEGGDVGRGEARAAVDGVGRLVEVGARVGLEARSQSVHKVFDESMLRIWIRNHSVCLFDLVLFRLNFDKGLNVKSFRSRFKKMVVPSH